MNDVDAKIDDGSYFTEARIWYNEVFLRPAVMTAVMRFLAYVIITLSVIVAYNIHNNFPLVRKVNIVARLMDTAKHYPVIKKLDDSKGIKQAVIRYLAERYIEARERYTPDYFVRNYFFIQQSSEKTVFEEYYNGLKQSTDEALELYKKGYNVAITPISFEYDAKKKQISVVFEKKITSKKKKIADILTYEATMIAKGEKLTEKLIKSEEEEVIDRLKLKATMTFFMSDYNFNESITKNLVFIVTSYKLEQMKK